MRSLIQEMGGNPQDLIISPPNARRSEGERVRDESRGKSGDKVGARPPLGGRGMPDEQARAIVDRIINVTPERGPHSGQTSDLPQQG